LQPLVHDVASAPAPQRSDDTGGPTAEALERNVIVLVESPAAHAERYPELDSTAATGASATVPLSAGSAVVGIVELLFGEWRDFDAADREFLAAFGRQGGVALERARLQAEEHSIATRLQRELLPLRLPVVPGLVHAVEYHAGAELMDVGGDWYDVVQLGPSLVALTVGDVVGKGVAAAGVMGRLRSALRALALAFEQPQQVIAHLERYAATIEGADVATVWYGTLELQRGLLRHLSAGHPPVLVASPGGEARFLTEGRSAPLCVPLDEPRPWADTQLERGETLLLYSDGLVERRDQLLDARLDLLVEEVRALDGLPPAELAPGLVATMAAGSPATDDVVVVAVRYEGA
jgi:serine phosphatase RsbU (regulator of sigma subunit)